MSAFEVGDAPSSDDRQVLPDGVVVRTEHDGDSDDIAAVLEAG